jgi:hypothetical protein
MSTVADRADQLADMRLVASAEARCWEGWTAPEVSLGDAAGTTSRRLEAVSRHRAIEHYWEMEILCAQCGCLVKRGSVVTRCGTSDCCCAHLPDVDRHVAEDVAK